MLIKFHNTDTPLKVSWYPEAWSPKSTLEIGGTFQSLFKFRAPTIPGSGAPNINNPDSLPRVSPVPSTSIVTSLLGFGLMIEGTNYGDYVISSDLIRPIKGSTLGNLTLLTRNLDAIDPTVNPHFKAGTIVSLGLVLPNLPIPILEKGYIIEPPKFQIVEGSLGQLTIRVGDILALRSQSDFIPDSQYCGLPPRTTAQTAQLFSTIRKIGGIWGGNGVVEGIDPDFIAGAPYEFLASLYEPLNWDVRSTVQGLPIAVPRSAFNVKSAQVLTADLVQEATLDSPLSVPYSIVPGYNSFSRDMGFRQRNTTDTDYSNWDVSDTRPFIDSNKYYTVTKKSWLGDTAVNEVVEKWGYLPTNSVLPPENTPQGSYDSCGGYTPPPSVIPVETSLDLIETTTTVLTFENHISGNYLITGVSSQTKGWSSYPGLEGSTILFFGDQAGQKTVYGHTPIPDDDICPQYWPVLRTSTNTLTYGRVTFKSDDIVEPSYQNTGRAIEDWARDKVGVTEGQVLEWTSTKTNQTFEPLTGRWVGGSSTEQGSPPSASFVSTYKVPVQLESEVRVPELIQIFGERKSKPVNFPNAFTVRDLAVATERFARESAGLAYSVMLMVDPRVPLVPGASVIYKRVNGSDIHGVVWAVEFNTTGQECTQAVTLLRTFTEPALIAIRDNSGFDGGSKFSTVDPCS